MGHTDDCGLELVPCNLTQMSDLCKLLCVADARCAIEEAVQLDIQTHQRRAYACAISKSNWTCAITIRLSAADNAKCHVCTSNFIHYRAHFSRNCCLNTLSCHIDFCAAMKISGKCHSMDIMGKVGQIAKMPLPSDDKLCSSEKGAPQTYQSGLLVRQQPSAG